MNFTIPPAREWVQNLVTHYPHPQDQPAWTLTTVYNSQVPFEFGFQKKLTKRKTIDHFNKILSPFGEVIPEYFGNQNMHVVSRIKLEA